MRESMAAYFYATSALSGHIEGMSNHAPFSFGQEPLTKIKHSIVLGLRQVHAGHIERSLFRIPHVICTFLEGITPS